MFRCNLLGSFLCLAIGTSAIGTSAIADTTNMDTLSRCQAYFPSLASINEVESKGQSTFTIVKNKQEMLDAMLLAVKGNTNTISGSQVATALSFCVSELKKNLDASLEREASVQRQFQTFKSQVAANGFSKPFNGKKSFQLTESVKLEELKRRLDTVYELMDSFEK